MRLGDRRRELAAWALAQGANQAGAARAAGVDRSSVTRWLDDPGFSGRVDELRLLVLQEQPIDEVGLAEEAEAGLARLIPIAEAVVEAALRGEPYAGKPVTAAQHRNALETIKLARTLEPKQTRAGAPDTPSLAELIKAADAPD